MPSPDYENKYQSTENFPVGKLLLLLRRASLSGCCRFSLCKSIGPMSAAATRCPLRWSPSVVVHSFPDEIGGNSRS